MISFKILLLLLSAYSCWAFDSNAIDAAAFVNNPCLELRLSGFVCIDCATLAYCAYMDDSWQSVQMTTCDMEHGFFCSDEDNIGCTRQPQCEVPVRGKFHCQQPGIFPDPYDCRSYHVCNEQNVDTPKRCTNGFGYSLSNHSCSLSRESQYCKNKQYSCSHEGQTGVWAANSSFYYVCQLDRLDDVYYPLMLECRPGYVFNGHSCVPQTNRTSRRSLVPVEELSASCIDYTTYPANTTAGYYFCLNGVLHYQTCQSGFYYDATQSICIKIDSHCIDGDIYAAETPNGFYICLTGELYYQSCPEGYQFMQAETVCIKVPPAQDALLCGDVGAQINAIPAKCSRQGYSADLTNCQRYYYCSGSQANMKHAYCPDNYYFDASLNYCVRGNC